MKTNTILIPLLLLLIATGLYTTSKAATDDNTDQQTNQYKHIVFLVGDETSKNVVYHFINEFQKKGMYLKKTEDYTDPNKDPVKVTSYFTSNFTVQEGQYEKFSILITIDAGGNKAYNNDVEVEKIARILSGFFNHLTSHLGSKATPIPISCIIRDCTINNNDIENENPLLNIIKKSYSDSNNAKLKPFFKSLLKNPDTDNPDKLILNKEVVVCVGKEFDEEQIEQAIARTVEEIPFLAIESLGSYLEPSKGKKIGDTLPEMKKLLIGISVVGGIVIMLFTYLRRGVKDSEAVDKHGKKVGGNSVKKHSKWLTTSTDSENSNNAGWGAQKWLLLIILVVLALGVGYWYFGRRKKS